MLAAEHVHDRIVARLKRRRSPLTCDKEASSANGCSYGPQVIHSLGKVDVLVIVWCIGVTMFGFRRTRPVRGGSRNDAATWPEFFLARSFPPTLIHFGLAPVKGFEFLDRNQLRHGPIGISMNLLNLVVLLLR